MFFALYLLSTELLVVYINGIPLFLKVSEINSIKAEPNFELASFLSNFNAVFCKIIIFMGQGSKRGPISHTMFMYLEGIHFVFIT